MTTERSGAFEWGLASMGIGAVALLAASPAMLLFIWFVGTGVGVPIYTIFGGVWAGGMQCLGCSGLAAGLRSVTLARRAGRPVALGAAGLLLNVAAMLAWATVVALGYVVTADFGATSYGSFLGSSL